MDLDDQELKGAYMAKKNMAVEMVMSFAERKRLADFFVILIAVDKRRRAQNGKIKKVRKTKTKIGSLGSQRCGSLFFLRTNLTLQDNLISPLA